MPKGVLGRAPCVIPGCGRAHKALGYCDMHYLRSRRYGPEHVMRSVVMRDGKPCGGRRPEPQSLRLPTESTELAYLAGIIDGEGSISTLKKQRHSASRTGRRWVVTVANTHEPLLQWLLSFGGAIHSNGPSSLSKRPCWRWQVVAMRDSLALLESIRPYLRIKAEKADQAIEELHEWLKEVES